MFKKFSTVIAILLVLALLLPSCGTGNEPEATSGATAGTTVGTSATTAGTTATTSPQVMPTNIFDEDNWNLYPGEPN